MTECTITKSGGIRSELHKARIGDTNHQRFVDHFDHDLLARMRELRQAGAELALIAAETGKSKPTVSRWLRHGCQVRQNTRTCNPHQAGVPFLSEHGYLKVTREDGKTVYVHQVIAERVLGRPLSRHERVHHVNCNKTDNRPTNLLICTHAYHMALHARMRKHPYWSLFPKSTTKEKP